MPRGHPLPVHERGFPAFIHAGRLAAPGTDPRGGFVAQSEHFPSCQPIHLPLYYRPQL